MSPLFFFFNDTATTEIYTLSLHDALPIYDGQPHVARQVEQHLGQLVLGPALDRKSTRLNSSHVRISYAVFCLKKKKKQKLLRISVHGCTTGCPSALNPLPVPLLPAASALL